MKYFLFALALFVMGAGCSSEQNESPINDIFFLHGEDCDPVTLDTLDPTIPDGFYNSCLERKEIWKDEFDNNMNGWSVSNFSSQAVIENGYYQIGALYPWVSLVDIPAIQMDTDFELEMWLALENTDASAKAVFLWGSDGLDKSYALILNANGQGGLFRSDKVQADLPDYQQLLAFKPGQFHYEPGLVCGFLIRHWRGAYHFFFNDTYLGTVPGLEPFGKTIGVRSEIGGVKVSRINHAVLSY